MPNLKNSEAIERLKNDIESEANTCKYIGTTVVRTKDLESLIGMHEASGMSKWTNIKIELPSCEHECQEDPNDDGYPQFDGFISQSVEITDGTNWARGHYRDDGTWKIYGSDYDFLMVEPSEITHWQPMIKLPWQERAA